MTDNKARRQIQRMSKEEIEALSQQFVNISRGMLTKRQVMAYLMLNVKELPVDEVAEYMGITESTVYTHRGRGRDKFISIKMVAEQTEELDWFMFPP